MYGVFERRCRVCSSRVENAESPSCLIAARTHLGTPRTKQRQNAKIEAETDWRRRMKNESKTHGIFMSIIAVLFIALLITPITEVAVFFAAYALLKMVGFSAAFSLALGAAFMVFALKLLLELFDPLFDIRKRRERNRRLQRLRENYCPECGFPRTGITSPHCPECGRACTDGIAPTRVGAPDATSG